MLRIIGTLGGERAYKKVTRRDITGYDWHHEFCCKRMCLLMYNNWVTNDFHGGLPFAKKAIRVTIVQGETILRIWCFNNCHTKLIFTCLLHMLVWHEEVWMRNIALKEHYFWEDVMDGDSFWPLFIVIMFQILMTHRSKFCDVRGRGYHWMVPVTASTRFINFLVCLDTKLIDQITHFFSRQCRLIKENKKNACVIEQKTLISLSYAICTSIVPSNKFILYKIQIRCLLITYLGHQRLSLLCPKH